MLTDGEFRAHDREVHGPERQDVENADLRHFPLATGEPAATLDVSGQHLLEQRAVRGRALHRGGHLDDGRLIRGLARHVGRRLWLLEREPVELVEAQRQKVWQLADGRELGLAEQLARLASLVCGEVQLDVLHAAREVRDDEYGLVLVLPDEGENVRIVRREELDRAAAERLESLAQRDDALRPPKQRVGILLLRFDVQ